MHQYTFHLPMGEEVYVIIVHAIDINQATDRAVALDGDIVDIFKGTTSTGRVYLKDIKFHKKYDLPSDKGLTP